MLPGTKTPNKKPHTISDIGFTAHTLAYNRNEQPSYVNLNECLSKNIKYIKHMCIISKVTVS